MNRMYKNIEKRVLHKVLAVFLLLAAAVTAAYPRTVTAYAAENSVAELRGMQDMILNWKYANGGENQILAGDLLDGAGEGGSDWIAFNISRMGVEDNQAAYLSRLQDVVEKLYQDTEGNGKKYRLSDIYRMIITIKACGGNPEAFGKDPEGNSINLLDDGIWNSIWGDPGKQGINGYIWALMAVDSKAWEEPQDAEWTREKLVTSILSRQLEDGGFGLIKTDASDVDLTSMALTALSPYAGSEVQYTFTSETTGQTVTETVDKAAEAAFTCISGMQHEDGSMVTYEQRTSESTSWALMALASWGRDPDTDEQFIKNGNTLLDGLRQFQLEDGSIVHSLDAEKEETEGNNMAGYQAMYGLEAVCRLKEGKCNTFDLSDAPTVSAEEIEKAGNSLPELKADQEKSGEEALEDTKNRTALITAGIAAVIVLIVMIFIIMMLNNRKKKKMLSDPDSDNSISTDDDDDDW